MRKIANDVFSIFWTSEDDQMPKIVNEYHDHYNRIDKLIQGMPGVLKLIHDDLAWIDCLTPKTGSPAVEVDVFIVGPQEFVAWTQSTKGKRHHYGKDADGNGRGREKGELA